jgi:hypothetical protein
MASNRTACMCITKLVYSTRRTIRPGCHYMRQLGSEKGQHSASQIITTTIKDKELIETFSF